MYLSEMGSCYADETQALALPSLFPFHQRDLANYSKLLKLVILMNSVRPGTLIAQSYLTAFYRCSVNCSANRLPQISLLIKGWGSFD